MLISNFATALLLTVSKSLSNIISPTTIVFAYKLALLLLISIWILFTGFKVIYTKKLHLYALGALFSTFGSICLHTAISTIPVASATCLGYMEKIILVMLGIILFKEKATFKKFMALGLGVIGAIVIFNNLNFSHIEIGYKYIALSIILWVMYCLTIKFIGDLEHLKTQVFYNTFFTVILTSFISLPKFAFINNHNTLLIFSPAFFLPILLMAFCYMVRLICSFKALQLGELSVVAPVGFSKVVFSGIISALFFAQYPTINELIGYSMIMTATFILF